MYTQLMFAVNKNLAFYYLAIVQVNHLLADNAS
ncbi:hypothetical protein DN35_2941 [Vibrio cholerae]|nr:hypothetical protein DN35_2941 [Vibrio cholerae]